MSAFSHDKQSSGGLGFVSASVHRHRIDYSELMVVLIYRLGLKVVIISDDRYCLPPPLFFCRMVLRIIGRESSTVHNSRGEEQ